MHKYDSIQWYHCLIPSIILHIAFISLVVLDVIGIDLHIFASERYTERPISTFPVYHWISSDIVSPEDSMVQPEAVSAEENLFENEETETVSLPVLHFSEPDSNDADPEAESAQADTNSDPIEDTSIPSITITESNNSDSNTESSSSNALPSVVLSGNANLHHPQSTQASVSSSANTAPSPDLQNIIWKNYTQKLSEHFKSHKHYPEMARRLRLSGTVWVSVKLNRRGDILSVTVTESSGNSILDQAAVQSAKSAAPVPPFPPETTEDTKTVKIPYHYRIK